MIPTGGGFDPERVEAAAWFDGSADKLYKSFGAATDAKKFINSVFFQRGEFGRLQFIWDSTGEQGNDRIYAYFNADDTLTIGGFGGAGAVTTTQKFRDCHYYNLIMSLDTTDTSRFEVWLNGELLTDFSYDTRSGISLNATSSWGNSGTGHCFIGAWNTSYLFKGNMAQFVSLDGVSFQAGDYNISDFLEPITVGTNGQRFAPKSDAAMIALADTVGGNSFVLSSAIGDGTDASSNGQDWTPYSMDHATNGHGNTPSDPHPIWNPCDVNQTVIAEGGSYLNGHAYSSGNYNGAGLNIAIPLTGKWYFETISGDRYATYASAGLAPYSLPASGTNSAGESIYYGALDNATTPNTGLGANYNGKKAGFYAASGTTNFDITEADASTIYSNGEVYSCFCYDFDNARFWWGTAFIGDSNLTWFGPSGSGADPTSPSTGLDISAWMAQFPEGQLFRFFHSPNGAGAYCKIPPDEASYAFTPPEGYLIPKLSNLPAPSEHGCDWFNALAYEGTGPQGESTGPGVAGYLYLDRQTRIPNDTVITELNIELFTANTGGLYVMERTSAGNYDIKASVMYSHTGSGLEGFALSYTVPSSGDFYVGVVHDSAPAANDKVITVTRAQYGPGLSNPLTGSLSSVSESPGGVWVTGYNGITARDQSVTGAGFQPDLGIWKNRDTSGAPLVIDTLRSNFASLFTNSSAAEVDEDELQSFDEDGFSITYNASYGRLNAGANDYIAWLWKTQQADDTSWLWTNHGIQDGVEGFYDASSTSTNLSENFLGLFDGVQIESGGATWHRLLATITPADDQLVYFYCIYKPGTSGKLYFTCYNGNTPTSTTISGTPGSLNAYVTGEGTVEILQDEQIGASGYWVLRGVVSIADQGASVTSLGVGPNSAVSGEDITVYAFNASYEDFGTIPVGNGYLDMNGTVPSVVSVADAGHFSIASYTGTGSGTPTIGHGLPGAPDLSVAKSLSGRNWMVHMPDVMASTQALNLDTTGAVYTPGSGGVTSHDANTVALSGVNVNAAEDYIALFFRNVPGVCKVGSYEGNGSADGPFIDLGFTPRWIMIKDADSTSNWYVIDTTIEPTNQPDGYILMNYATSQYSGRSDTWDMLSTGIKLRTSDAEMNANGNTFIYIAMADIGYGEGLPPPLGR
jgi:hypothetical protein